MGGTFTMPLHEVYELTKGKIGLDDYPIFDEAYRATLNTKIRRHYWNQEIGQETISQFQMAMSRLMAEIMPYYNEQYKLSRIIVDPLSTIDIRQITGTTNANESSGTVTASTDTNAKSRAVASEFPQNSLQPNADYASSAQDNISDSKGTTENLDTRTDNSTGSVDNRSTGYQGHAPELIRATRDALVNVDLMVINEIERAGLFMLIYSIPDNFINPRSFLNGYY